MEILANCSRIIDPVHYIQFEGKERENTAYVVNNKFVSVCLLIIKHTY